MVERARTLRQRAARAFRRLGFFGFFRLCARNLYLLATGRAAQHAYVYDDTFDREYDVDTAGVVAIEEMGDVSDDDAKASAEAYEATPPECFSYLVDQADVRDPQRYRFVDLGSGKGRVLLLAALRGFNDVVGVEFAEDLHSIACENIKRFAVSHPAVRIISVVGDAGAYQFDAVPTVCFLNNPFGPDVLQRALRNMETSLHAEAREFRLIYYHCNHIELINSRAGWEPIARGHWPNDRHHYAIFRWTSERLID